jgi:aryl-alcohol dehydrogenase-like predicted oxidoreductase
VNNVCGDEERSVLRGLPKVSFRPTGQRVTRLGLGGEGVLRTFGREGEARAVIEAALAEGITYLESARAYAGSEAYYGRALGERRADIFLATKAHDRTKAGARAMLDESLKALRTDHLDLWQFHDVREAWEVDSLEDPAGAYAAFAEAKERGDVRAIGVTGHHDPAVLRAALERVPFDAVLLPINPAEGVLADGFERTVVPAARARKMAIVGMKVFLRGLALDRRAAGLTVDEALSYALSADVDVLVVGCDEVEHVRANASAARAFSPLDGAARRALEARVASAADRLAYYRAPKTLV